MVGHSRDIIGRSPACTGPILRPAEWQDADNVASQSSVRGKLQSLTRRSTFSDDGSRVPVLSAPAAFDGPREPGRRLWARFLTEAQARRGGIGCERNRLNRACCSNRLTKGFCTIEVFCLRREQKPVRLSFFFFFFVKSPRARRFEETGRRGSRMQPADECAKIAPQHETIGFEILRSTRPHVRRCAFEHEATTRRWYDVSPLHTYTTTPSG